jgi:hypothetical protein
MSEINSELKKIKDSKPRKKKRIPALPKHNIIIKNADKDVGNWKEDWDHPKNRDISHIPHSFRLCALGAPGKGKTNYLKQLFLRHQSSSKKFKRLVVVTGDLSTKEWDDCEPTMLIDTIPEIEMFHDSVKTCVIIDDYEFEKCGSREMRKLTTLFRMISTHKSVSVMASYQSFFHTPTICRKTANVFILYKPTSDNELVTIANRVGIPHDKLKKLFKKHCPKYYDMIMIDLTKDSPYPVRKNIYENIPYDSDSDESD